MTELNAEVASLAQKVTDLRAARSAALGTIRQLRSALAAAEAEPQAGPVSGLRAEVEAAQGEAERLQQRREADLAAMQAAEGALSLARQHIGTLEATNAVLTEQVVAQAERLASAHKRSTSAVEELKHARAEVLRLVIPPSSRTNKQQQEKPHLIDVCPDRRIK